MIREDVPAVDLGVVALALDPAIASISLTPVGVSASGPRHMFPGIHFWRLFSLFEDADNPSYAVIGGHLDAVIVDLDEPDVDDRLYMSLNELQFHEQLDAVTNLVGDPESLAAAAELAGFDSEPARLLLILDIVIDQTLRGRDLGLALLGEMYEFFEDDAPTTLVVAPAADDTAPALIAYWHKHLGTIRGDDGLLILPNTPTLPSVTDIIAKCKNDGYINVDAAGLRSRLESHDDTLFATRDGRDDGNESAVADFAGQAAEAVEIAMEATQYDEAIEPKIATVITFLAHAGDDNCGHAEVFAYAAEYLETHPDVSVIATNWRTEPCADGDTHLTLELIVRPSE